VPRTYTKTLFMNTKFTVVACNPSNQGKTFVWKLEVSASAKIFGITKTVKRTYYIGGMPQEVKLGHTIEEDMSKLEVVERPYTYTEEGEEHTIMLKWLHVKLA